MATLLQAVRGMNDILPAETVVWQFVENSIRDVLHSYAYQEIRFPIVEKTELFKRSIGEATDIVEKEMYTFLDRNNESLTLRPEGTACCVRAGLEHGLLYNQTQRLWYAGPYFRHERPQKGRYRQFHQVGAEIFGIETPDADAELILLSAKILDKLGLTPYVNLELNSLGSTASRAAYRAALVEYLTTHEAKLDEDSKRRLLTNPLRILDSKNPEVQAVVKNAPKLVDFLDEESKTHFAKLCSYLDSAGLKYHLNPCLVRGLDYYSKTVFEWVTTSLGAQGTVCGGGRYDGLLELLGSKPTPALGFAIGIERIVLLMQEIHETLPANTPHVYFISDGDSCFQQAIKIADQIRDALPGVRVLLHCGGGALKNQFKKADKSGAELALILGENEMQNAAVGLKYLRKDAPQETVKQELIVAALKKIL